MIKKTISIIFLLQNWCRPLVFVESNDTGWRLRPLCLMKIKHVSLQAEYLNICVRFLGGWKSPNPETAYEY